MMACLEDVDVGDVCIGLIASVVFGGWCVR